MKAVRFYVTSSLLVSCLLFSRFTDDTTSSPSSLHALRCLPTTVFDLLQPRESKFLFPSLPSFPPSPLYQYHKSLELSRENLDLHHYSTNVTSVFPTLPFINIRPSTHSHSAIFRPPRPFWRGSPHELLVYYYCCCFDHHLLAGALQTTNTAITPIANYRTVVKSHHLGGEAINLLYKIKTEVVLAAVSINPVAREATQIAQSPTQIKSRLSWGSGYAIAKRRARPVRGRLRTNQISHTRRLAFPTTYPRSSSAFAPGERRLGGYCRRCSRQQQQRRCRRRWGGCFWRSRRILPLLFLSAEKRHRTCRRALSSSFFVGEKHEKETKNYELFFSRPIGWLVCVTNVIPSPSLGSDRS